MKSKKISPMCNETCSSLESAPFAEIGAVPTMEQAAPSTTQSSVPKTEASPQSAETAACTVPEGFAQPLAEQPMGAAQYLGVGDRAVRHSSGVPIPVAKIDKWFALLYIAVGYAFICVFTSTKSEFLYTAFTLFYAATVLCYAFAHGKRPSVESWFWLGAMLCLAVPFGYYSVLYGLQMIALCCTAAYWTLCVTGALMDESGTKTSSWLAFDVLNAQLIVPYGNFGAHAKVLLRTMRQTKIGRTLLNVLLGVVLAIPIFCWVLPLLSSADAGFAGLLENFVFNFSAHFYEFFLKFMLSLPVTTFLFGLVYGGIYKRRTQCVQKTKVLQIQDAMHRLPNTAIYTALALLCAVYVLFIGLQGQYLFSAFWGTLPDGFTFSHYARTGFFELCRIAAINGSVLAIVNTFARTPRKINAPLRAMNGALSLLSLLLLGTAASKMGLYISQYGLSTRRVLVSVFLLWMAIVFVAILVWQVRNFALVRWCTLSGAVLFCALCLVPVQSCIDTYNVARVENGTLTSSYHYENGEASTLDWIG